MSDAKIIKCNKECLNWDESLNDCKFGHDIYQSNFGILYVPVDCPDFEPMGDEIDEFLQEFGDGDYEVDDGYEDEVDDGYEEEYEEPIRETRVKRRPIHEERKPVREKTDFRERTRQKIKEAREKKSVMKSPVQKERTIKEYDPMEELKKDAEKNNHSILGELLAFKEQVESGMITPEQIQKDIESLNGKNVDIPEISDLELEEIRRKAGVASKKSKIKKPAKK